MNQLLRQIHSLNCSIFSYNNHFRRDFATRVLYKTKIHKENKKSDSRTILNALTKQDILMKSSNNNISYTLNEYGSKEISFGKFLPLNIQRRSKRKNHYIRKANSSELTSRLNDVTNINNINTHNNYNISKKKLKKIINEIGGTQFPSPHIETISKITPIRTNKENINYHKFDKIQKKENIEGLSIFDNKKNKKNSKSKKYIIRIPTIYCKEENNNY